MPLNSAPVNGVVLAVGLPLPVYPMKHEGHAAVRRRILEQDFQRFNACFTNRSPSSVSAPPQASQDRSSIHRMGDDLKPGGASGYS